MQINFGTNRFATAYRLSSCYQAVLHKKSHH